MNYRLNPDCLGDIFAVPAVVVDEHIKLAGSAQLKVLLWLLRGGQGVFDAALCSKAIGLSPADCTDALQFWIATGVLLKDLDQHQPDDNNQKVSSPPQKKESKTNSSSKEPQNFQPVVPRPRPVKPSMRGVIKRQKENAEFAYLLDTASARLGRPITHGDMETLLYLYDSAGMPVEVILMVIEYAVAEGKSNMRYIERVALDWADRGLNTIAAAEQYLCKLERRREAWNKLSVLLRLNHSPTIAQSNAAEKWIVDWQIDDRLLELAYKKTVDATGKFNSNYMMKIIEQWRANGIDSLEKATNDQGKSKAKGRKRTNKETSFDLDEYENMVSEFTPVYKKN
jgi:DnaD/phage-associated family protein